MAYTIGERCISCGLCEEKCPFGAILFNEADESFRIDPEACQECGVCEKNCLIGAIAQEGAASSF